MKDSIIPKTYDEWVHCITVECGLKLTPDYISQRITSLQNSNDHYTQQFLKLYGKQHHQRVLDWFVQAQKGS